MGYKQGTTLPFEMNNALVIWKVTQAIDYFEGNGRRKAMIMKIVPALAISSCTTDWNYSDTVSIIFCMNMMKTTV